MAWPELWRHGELVRARSPDRPFRRRSWGSALRSVAPARRWLGISARPGPRVVIPNVRPDRFHQETSRFPSRTLSLLVLCARRAPTRRPVTDIQNRLLGFVPAHSPHLARRAPASGHSFSTHKADTALGLASCRFPGHPIGCAQAALDAAWAASFRIAASGVLSAHGLRRQRFAARYATAQVAAGASPMSPALQRIQEADTWLVRCVESQRTNSLSEVWHRPH